MVLCCFAFFLYVVLCWLWWKNALIMIRWRGKNMLISTLPIYWRKSEKYEREMSFEWISTFSFYCPYNDQVAWEKYVNFNCTNLLKEKWKIWKRTEVWVDLDLLVLLQRIASTLNGRLQVRKERLMDRTPFLCNPHSGGGASGSAASASGCGQWWQYSETPCSLTTAIFRGHRDRLAGFTRQFHLIIN